MKRVKLQLVSEGPHSRTLHLRDPESGLEIPFCGMKVWIGKDGAIMADITIRPERIDLLAECGFTVFDIQGKEPGT